MSGDGVLDGSTRAPSRFFDDAWATFERAASAAERRHVLAIGGRRVALRFAGSELEDLLLPALHHLVVAPTESTGMTAPDLEVAIFDSASTATPMIPPAWTGYHYGAKGEIVGFNDDRIRTTYQPGVDILNVYDRASSRAVYWVAEPSIIPWWETSFPLRSILHWHLAPTASQPVHAGAVGRGGRGVLVVGNSGAGKSTSTLACLRSGMQYCGDDYVLVDVDALVVHSLYRTAKLEAHNTHRFPELTSRIVNADRLDTEKAMVLLDADSPQIVSCLDIEAIVMPQVTGRRDTELLPVSPARALSVLAPTTSFHLPGYGAEVFTKLNRLVRSRPCFTLAAGTDLEQIPAVLGDLLTRGR